MLLIVCRLIECMAEESPCYGVHRAAIRATVAEAVPEPVLPVSGGTETILMAEDDGVVRKFARELLEEYGYTFIEAVDGEDAVQKFKENREDISLILSDVIMPRKNGREILEEVRQIKPAIKVLFISGYTSNVMHEKGILEEGMDFLAKPFVKDELLRKVREVLDKG